MQKYLAKISSIKKTTIFITILSLLLYSFSLLNGFFIEDAVCISSAKKSGFSFESLSKAFTFDKTLFISETYPPLITLIINNVFDNSQLLRFVFAKMGLMSLLMYWDDIKPPSLITLINNYVSTEIGLSSLLMFWDSVKPPFIFKVCDMILDRNYKTDNMLYFRPVTVLSHKIDTIIWGSNLNYYHLQNILFATLANIAVFFLAYNLFDDVRSAFLAAIIFLFGHLNMIPVFFITARGDILCTFFLTVSIIFMLKCIKTKKNATFITCISISLILFLLSMLSKETSVILPLISAIIMFYHSRFARKKSAYYSLTRALMFSSAYFFVFAIYFIVRMKYMGLWPLYSGLYNGDGFYVYPVLNFALFKTIYYFIQKYLWAYITLIFFLIPFPIRGFINNPIYMFFSSIFITVSIYIAYKIFYENLKSKQFQMLLILNLIAFIPTLPITLSPHHFYTPTVFYSIILACLLNYEHQNYYLKNYKLKYFVVYFIAGCFINLVSCTVFYYVSSYNNAVCELMKDKYDNYQKSVYYKNTGKKPEFYLFDFAVPLNSIFSEFKIRYEEKKDFRSCIINYVFNLDEAPSLVNISPDSITIEAQKSDLYFGFLEKTVSVNKLKFSIDRDYASNYYTLQILNLRKIKSRDSHLISKLKLVFKDKDRLESNNLFFINANAVEIFKNNLFLLNFGKMFIKEKFNNFF